MTTSVNESSKLLIANGNDCKVNYEYEVEFEKPGENRQDEEPGKTGTFSAIFIVVNAAMGAGLLNMPQAFKNAGGIFPGVTLEMVSLNEAKHITIFLSMKNLQFLHVFLLLVGKNVLNHSCQHNV